MNVLFIIQQNFEKSTLIILLIIYIIEKEVKNPEVEMKKFVCVFIAVALLLLTVGCADLNSPTLSMGENNITDSSAPSSSEDASCDNTSSEEEWPVFDFDSYELRLVNPWNFIPDDFEPELENIDKAYAGFEGAQFDARAIDQLHALCNAAKADGVELTVISAYRTNSFQTFNFNRKVDRVMSENPNLTREEAENQAEKVVARPGTSEHQIGLAVDFNSVEDSFKSTKAYAWLVEHCSDYGFILRYTEEKQETTGIISEPWHYRYVGIEAAKTMEEENLCLEEFIEKYSQAE